MVSFQRPEPRYSLKVGHRNMGEHHQSCQIQIPSTDENEQRGENVTKKLGVVEPTSRVPHGAGNVGAEAEAIVRQARLEAERQASVICAEAARSLRRSEIVQREAAATTRRVVMGGSTLVTCGAGLRVQDIVCGFDSRNLTIKNLPASITLAEIEELFTQQGVEPSSFFLKDLQQGNGGLEATVMIDAESGSNLAAALNGNGTVFGDNHVLDIMLEDNDILNRTDSTSERDANMLTVTWASTSVTMVALYRSTTAALNAVNRLDNTIFRGHRMQAGLTYGPNDEKGLTTSVKLTGMPCNVTYKEAEDHTGAYLVRAFHPLFICGTIDVEKDLRRHMDQLGRFNTYEVNPATPNKPTVEIHVRFLTPRGAQKAYNSLKKQRSRFICPSLSFWLPKPTQFSIVIPLAQYRAQKGRWDSIAERDDNKAAFVQIIVNGFDPAFIRVLGENNKAVGRLKVRVENLVAGETLDVRLWHQSFLGASGRRFLDGVCSRTGSYVRADRQTKTLKVYLENNRKGVVEELIKAEIDRLEASEWSIPFDRCGSTFMCQGVSRLEEELGEGVATLELTPTPRFEESRSGIRYDAMDAVCPICFDEVSSPVLLTCGHFYCTGCIQHLLSSAAEMKEFPLTCAGDEDGCKAPIAIPIIQRILLEQQFDQLVEAAATAYIEKRPTKFKHCPTPDCLQVYRCNRQSQLLTCPSCFTRICTRCYREAHDGMTCREREIMDNPEEQERLNEKWARASGAKRCPSCRVWIQKSAGCNHISCRCGAHVCWTCLASFPTSDNTYTHLRETHGGANQEDVQQAQAQAQAAREQADFEYAQRLQLEELDERQGPPFNAIVEPVDARVEEPQDDDIQEREERVAQEARERFFVWEREERQRQRAKVGCIIM